MKITYHLGYTEKALTGIKIDDAVKREIMKGASANDLCEFNDQLHWLFHPEDDNCGETKGFFDSIAFIDSHFGYLSSMHSMAKCDGENPETTKAEIAAWFDFFNALVLCDIAIDPTSEIRDDNVAISKLFRGYDNTIKYSQLFDSADVQEIRSRAIGMMCHLIQDMFTVSHCNRNHDNKIVKFYCYHSQDRASHSKHDYAVPEFRNKLVCQCRKCIESVCTNQPYDYTQVLNLSADAQRSDGGVFCKK